jgi:hypothetical protein
MIKSEISKGGIWDAVALQKAETHMAGLRTPFKGGPKTATSIKTVWGQVCGVPFCSKIFDKVLIAQMKKTHESLLLVLQGQYPGASGWTYDRELGFSVRDNNLDAWKAFIKAHLVFRPFANKGWDLFDTIHDIVPTHAKGMHIHNPIHPPTSSLPAPGVPHLQGGVSMPNLHLENNDFPSTSQLLSFSQSQSTDSQPFTDWSQLNFRLQSGLDGFRDDNGLGFDFGSQSPFMQISLLAPTPTSSSVVSAHGPTTPAATTTSQVVVPATFGRCKAHCLRRSPDTMEL